MNSHSFTVLIPDGEYVLALHTVQCLAQEKNVKIIALSNNKNVAIRFSKHLSGFYTYNENSENGEDLLIAIHNTLTEVKVDVVLPVSDKVIRLLSEHKDEFLTKVGFGLLPSIKVFDIVNDKWYLYQWLKENKINSPNTFLYDNSSECKELLKKLVFPVLAKPTNLNGGKGINFFEDTLLLEEFLIDQSVDNTYLVQDYIEGHNLCFNVLALEGKILAYTIQKPIISSQKEFQPSYGLQYFKDHVIYELMEDIILKLNWTGISNFDLRFDKMTNEVKILEANPRIWGTVVGSCKIGVNFPYLSCLAGLGIDLPKVEFKETTCVIGNTAFKYGFDRLKRNKKFPPFEYNSMKIALQDPLPYFFIKYRNVFKLLNLIIFHSLYYLQ